LTFRTLLKILGEILGKPPNSANVADTLSPPALVRIGEFVPTGNEDDNVVVNRSPLLELCHPEIDEPPIAPLVVLPQCINEPRNIPPVPALVRSVGKRDTGRVIPREPCGNKLMP
jgi:hypothetical protein